MANTSKKESSDTTKPATGEEEKVMPFSKMNYIWVIIGVCVIALGFILMIGGGSSDPDVFNDKMFDFRHLTLAPVLCLIGFGIEFFAIMKSFKKKK